MAEQVVFVIGGDAEARRLAANALRHALGLHALPMAGGEPALAWARVLKPVAIVVDMRSRRQHDTAWLQELRTDRDTAAIPIVAVGDDAPAHDRARALGCVGFLAAPFTSEALVGLVRECLKVAGSAVPAADAVA